MPLDSYVATHIFTPLGIERFRWARDGSGRPMAHAALEMSARDLAKVGQMVMARGQWKGLTVLSSVWFDIATPSRFVGALDEPAGVWWFPIESASTVLTHGEVLPAMVAAGLSIEIAEKLKAWPPRQNGDDFFPKYAAAFSKDEQLSIRSARFKSKTKLFEIESTMRGYEANGGGGQYLVMLPESKLVAVRLIQRNWIKTTQNSLGEFRNEVLKFADALAP
jgi:CubicO group peptidase (beta-lactamase class C family)